MFSACTMLWPSVSEREYSLSVKPEMVGERLHQNELLTLLALSKDRYQELVRVGGQYCLPARMNHIQEEYQQINLTMDTRLLKEAEKRLEQTFILLNDIRQRLERQAETTGCPLQYLILENTRQNTKGKEDSVLGLGGWAQPKSLPLLLRSR